MLKKVISSILTFTLVASCITFSSNETHVKAESIPIVTSDNQIVYEGGTNEVSADKVSTSKTIEGTNVENEFDITLKVTTEEELKNISISPDAVTVLVLDRSGSMREILDGGTRFEKMQIAADDFLKKFADVESGSNAKRLVSIVSFSSDVQNETYSNGKNNWIDVAKSSNDLKKATDIIDNIEKPNGGTNIEGALIMANNIVNDGKSKNSLIGTDGKEIKNINIILLTDGSPTFHMSNSNTDSINKLTGTQGGGNYAKLSDWQPVGGKVNNVLANNNNISNKIKTSGTNLYTIAFSTTEDTFYYSNNNSIKLNPSDWMATFATRNFLAKDSNDLNEQFEKINKLIALSAQAWKVTDPMGENIIYKDITGFAEDNSFNFDDNTLTWDLKNSTPIESTTEEGNKKYTYTLKYRVVLDTIIKDANYEEVLTNGETILYYYLFSKQDEQEDIKLKETNFNVPRVKGLFGEVKFNKVNHNNEAISGVKFILSGTSTGSNRQVEISAVSDSSGNVLLTNIPSGKYTLKEEAPAGYIAAGPFNVIVSYGNVTKDTLLTDTIINYPAVRNINVEKEWSGLTEDKDIPESITVRLFKNDKVTDKMIILNTSNGWAGTFSDLPYIDENGVINYSIKEDKVEGYNSAITFIEDEDKYLITNEYNPDLINISGKKIWTDELGENIDGIVPNIEISLQRTTADNWDDESKIEDVETIELANGKTEYKFDNLPKTASNSKEYKYRVRESKVNGYEPIYNDKFDITNKYTPGSTKLTVKKQWINVDIEKDSLPTVKAILYQNGQEYRNEVLNNANGYTYTFNNLPKYEKSGNEYVYTVKESMQEGTVGYLSEQLINSDGSITIINTFDNEKIDIVGMKKWEGILNGLEVPSITLHLYQNGVELKDKVIRLEGGVKENGNESYVFKDIPKYSTDGKEYIYTVIEEYVDGYTSSGVANAENGYIITNTFAPGSIDVIGEKTWKGVTDLSVVPIITISLESSLNEGESWTPVSGKVIELAAGNTKYEFKDLPRYSVDGKEYKYRVVESAVDGYISSNNGSYNILNTYDPGETSIKVTKKWTNVDESIDNVPEVKIVLKQNGIEIDNVILNNKNQYIHVFESLDKYAQTGEEYVYTVEDVLSDDIKGYTNIITQTDNGFIIENILDTEAVTDITFNKVWENVPENSKVPSVTLHLYQNGVELKDRVVTLEGEVKEEGKETYVFKDLPKYSTDGKEYVYTIIEENVNGYTSSGEANSQNNYVITNTYDGGEKVVINGTKTWANVANIKNVPDITIRVHKDGEEIHSIVVKSGTTTYKIALDSMVKYAPDGHEYEYSLTEDKIDGFESVKDGYNFTNTMIVKEEAPKTPDVKNNNVKTGDNSIAILYSSLAIISLITIITLRKRKKSLEK
ncbi:Cna B-type domain-containing protein [Clostridium nigeriense]|uniref:Cna B-type domain-containing protein n=1 Tax=Clostridium nigeriense TaxID=1805470 RepID=UPI003D333289